MSIIQTFPLSPSVDTSDCMKKGVDYVTAGAATGSTIGSNATADGRGVVAYGDASHAEGLGTYAAGSSSHAEGYCTTAYGDNQTVVGKYNIVDTNGDYAFIVGNGTSTTASNALGVKWDGTVEAGGHALGTAAFKNIPSSGNAGSSEVVLGNDSRLSDSRTPTSHTHTKSEITDFPTLGTAAAKDYTSSVTQSSTDLVTSGAVWTAIDNLPEPMVFKGTLGTGGTITDLPTAAAANHGDTYKVITAGTYASIVAKVGDVFTSDGSSWILIPSGDTDSDTWRAIKVNGTEKLGSAISTGAVDFVNGTNTTVSFDATGSKVSFSATDEKITVQAQNPSSETTYNIPFVGTTNQNPYYNDGLRYTTRGGTTSAEGLGFIVLGNNKATGTDGNKRGLLGLYSRNTKVAYIQFTDSATADRAFILPDKAGTVALTADITDEKITGEINNPSSATWYQIPFIGTTNHKPYYNDGIKLYTQQGTTSLKGYNWLSLGNNISTGTDGNKYGGITIFSEKNGYVDIIATASSTTNRTLTLPDKTGTLAITTDTMTPASHTHPVSQLTWAGGVNLATSATGNGQEWSLDLNSGSYTGTYWHVWSAKLSKSILCCYNDNAKVTIPSGNLEVSGTVKVGNAVNLQYNSTTKSLDFVFV